jgi:protein-disulfide isomerase
MKSNRVLLMVTVFCVTVGVLLLAARWYRQREGARLAAVATAPNGQERLVRDYAPWKGAANGKVTIVEFFDPECESCRAAHPWTEALLQEFSGQVRLVLRYAAFHPNSKFAIQVLEAARLQGRYWETLEVLFQHQPEWGSHHHPQPERIWTYLPQVQGLDVERVRRELQSETTSRAIMQDAMDGEALGVRMTPAFFVNGKPLENFGQDPLRAMVIEALR